MNAIFWFWIGTMVGGLVGFACFCLVQAVHDPSEESQGVWRTVGAEVRCHAER